MKRKKLSLFEETKILMVMKIYNISRSKAIEYIAAKMPDDDQRKNDGSKSDHNISSGSHEADELMSAEEFFADASEGSEEIPEALRQGHIAYVINTKEPGSEGSDNDGHQIRNIATENNVTIFTALDTVKVLLDVLEETTLTISTIDA